MTWTKEYASAIVRHTFDRTSPIAAYATVPRSFVFIQRINLGLYALLGDLHATGNFRRMAEELWPFADGAPSTPMGEAEREWLVRRPRRSPLIPNRPETPVACWPDASKPSSGRGWCPVLRHGPRGLLGRRHVIRRHHPHHLPGGGHDTGAGRQVRGRLRAVVHRAGRDHHARRVRGPDDPGIEPVRPGDERGDGHLHRRRGVDRGIHRVDRAGRVPGHRIDRVDGVHRVDASTESSASTPSTESATATSAPGATTEGSESITSSGETTPASSVTGGSEPESAQPTGSEANGSEPTESSVTETTEDAFASVPEVETPSSVPDQLVRTVLHEGPSDNPEAKDGDVVGVYYVGVLSDRRHPVRHQLRLRPAADVHAGRRWRHRRLGPGPRRGPRG